MSSFKYGLTAKLACCPAFDLVYRLFNSYSTTGRHLGSGHTSNAVFAVKVVDGGSIGAAETENGRCMFPAELEDDDVVEDIGCRDNEGNLTENGTENGKGEGVTEGVDTSAGEEAAGTDRCLGVAGTCAVEGGVEGKQTKWATWPQEKATIGPIS